MSYNFLDKTGLTHLWDKIKSYITKKTIPLIEGTQASSTSAWTGVAPFDTLEDGQVINFYLPFASTGTAVTLNLTLSDGTTTGALPVYYNNGTERMTTHFGRGNVVGLMYRTSRVNSSGTTITNSWLHISDRDTVDQQILRFENGSMIAGTNGVINYGLCAVDNVGRYQSFVTTNGTGTSKTVNTSAKFRSPMVMCRNTANTKYTNGQEVGTGYNSYYVQRFDARYSCNGYGNFAKNTPTYLECTKDSDGYLSVTSNVLVQTFQSGKYYVYVGHSCRDYAYYLQLQPDHPTYYYDGTNLIPETELKADKADIPTKVSDLTNDSGFTSNTGTVTSVAVKMNGTSKGTVTTSGTIDLGTVITAHQDISGLAPKASPALTGTPTAPTATAGTNTTQIATTAFVQTAVSDKVDKVNGKALSSNDFTDTLKAKLDSLPTRKVLYTATAFSNTITLSETKENFDEIEVFYEYNNVQQCSKFQVKSGSQRTLLMYGWWDTTTSIAYQPQGITFDGTSVTYGHNAKANFTSGDSQMSYTGNNITITKIVGYKY